MNPDFDKQLSMVSIVGARGVGKSTVASLLSGNHSMFTVGSGSVGTTTTGADISTIIPSTDYAETMESKLGHVLNKVTDIKLSSFLFISICMIFQFFSHGYYLTFLFFSRDSDLTSTNVCP